MMSSNHNMNRESLLDAIDKIRIYKKQYPLAFKKLALNCPWKEIVELFNDPYKGIDVDFMCRDKHMAVTVRHILGFAKILNGSATSYILEELGEFIDLIRECNCVVMSERHPDMVIEWKTDGRGRKSAVTQADLKCNTLICDYLNDVCEMLSKRMGKRYIIISEENAEVPYEDRSGIDVGGAFWVDPLDGTANFIGMDKDTGEFIDNDFTVNIAYCEPVPIKNDDGNERMRWEPKFGIVSLPATGEIYFGHCDLGSYKIDATGEETLLGHTESFLNGNDIHLSMPHNNKLFDVGGECPPIRVAVSAKHPDPKTKGILERYFGQSYETIPAGSSKKILMVADALPRYKGMRVNEGVDIYVRPGPTMEWDIAAAHAVLKCSGGTLVEYVDGKNNFYDMPEVEYNKPTLYNPPFVAL